MDYEKILESLKICSEVGMSCEGCSGRGERHCIANLTKAAAVTIETLLHALDMAKRERDVVTKRMIELEQETVTNRNGLNEPLTLDELRQMDGEPVFLVDLVHKSDPKEPDLWGGWIVFTENNQNGFIPSGGGFFSIDGYGKTWLAYRQKPEEDDK